MDAWNAVHGLTPVNPAAGLNAIKYDMEMATNSLKKFPRFDIETDVCYHGGICTGNPIQMALKIAGTT